MDVRRGITIVMATLAMGTALAAAAAPAQAAVPAAAVHYVKGSSVTINGGSANGCKAWMNWKSPGPSTQGMMQSWGDYCSVALFRRYQHGTIHRVSSWYSTNHGKVHTGFYKDSKGYKTWVCVVDRGHNPDESCGRAW